MFHWGLADENNKFQVAYLPVSLTSAYAKLPIPLLDEVRIHPLNKCRIHADTYTKYQGVHGLWTHRERKSPKSSHFYDLDPVTYEQHGGRRKFAHFAEDYTNVYDCPLAESEVLWRLGEYKILTKGLSPIPNLMTYIYSDIERVYLTALNHLRLLRIVDIEAALKTGEGIEDRLRVAVFRATRLVLEYESSKVEFDKHLRRFSTNFADYMMDVQEFLDMDPDDLVEG